MTPEEQAKQIVENLHDGEYGVVFKATCAFKGPSDIESDLIIPAIAAALVAEGDRRAQEARERALELLEGLRDEADKHAERHVAKSVNNEVHYRAKVWALDEAIRALKGKDNGR